LLFPSYGPLIGENGLNRQRFKFFPIVALVKTLKPSALEPYCHQAYAFNQLYKLIYHADASSQIAFYD